MSRAASWGALAATVLVAGVSLSACSRAAEAGSETKAATVEAIEGTDRSRVILTEEARDRLDLQLGAVTAASAGPGREVPYAAVLYDPRGATWVFVKTEGLTFVREAITIDHIVGEVALLKDGPPVGTEVVTAGASELYGAEIGVGDE